MRLGIDVSEWNAPVDWVAARRAGVDFAIVRLGYGNGHLDSRFYAHVNGALAAELRIGVYFYSYALTEDAAAREAAFAAYVLRDAGLPAEKLPMGLWLDMEDADGYKTARGVVSRPAITALCRSFIAEAGRNGYPAGVYANYDWLTHRIDTASLSCPLWCAAWGSLCPLPRAKLWQFTDRLEIEGAAFDGDYEIS